MKPALRLLGAGLVLLMTVLRVSAAPGDTAPRLSMPVAPEYPAALKEKRIIGSADILCLVDETGGVRDPAVERASREEFGRAALEAVRRFKYEPAVRGGRPYAVRVRVPIGFELSDGDLAELETRRAKEVIPPGPPTVAMGEVDELPVLKKEIRPDTPATLKQDRRMGHAVMAFVVDEAGWPRDIHAVVTTDTECADEAAKAIGRWRFSPGKEGGHVVRVALEVPIMFFPEDPWASGLRVRPGVSRRITAEQKIIPQGSGKYEPPRPLKQQRLDYPEEMAARGISGRVWIDLIVGADGSVTHVHAASETNAFFAAVSERAVSYWTFTPARVNGVPVPCYARQLMEFGMRY